MVGHKGCGHIPTDWVKPSKPVRILPALSVWCFCSVVLARPLLQGGHMSYSKTKSEDFFMAISYAQRQEKSRIIFLGFIVGLGE